MKKILFLMSFFMVAGLTVNAQSCSKTCSKTCSKAKTASVESAEGTSVASAFMVADEAANANEMIEKRVCSKSGSVAYYEKSVCSASGKVSFDEVKYCTDSKKFVNVSPLDAAADSDASVIKTSEGATKKACSAAEKKACSKMSKEECSKKCTGKKATGV